MGASAIPINSCRSKTDFFNCHPLQSVQNQLLPFQACPVCNRLIPLLDLPCHVTAGNQTIQFLFDMWNCFRQQNWVWHQAIWQAIGKKRHQRELCLSLLLLCQRTLRGEGILLLLWRQQLSRRCRRVPRTGPWAQPAQFLWCHAVGIGKIMQQKISLFYCKYSRAKIASNNNKKYRMFLLFAFSTKTRSSKHSVFVLPLKQQGHIEGLWTPAVSL